MKNEKIKKNVFIKKQTTDLRDVLIRRRRQVPRISSFIFFQNLICSRRELPLFCCYIYLAVVFIDAPRDKKNISAITMHKQGVIRIQY